MLLYHLSLDIPWENHHVIWFCLFDAIRMINRNVRAGQKFTLFVGAAIDDVLEKIRPNSAIIQKSVTFSRRAIPDNRAPFSFCLNQKVQELAFCFLYFFREGEVRTQTCKAGFFFTVTQLEDTLFYRL